MTSKPWNLGWFGHRRTKSDPSSRKRVRDSTHSSSSALSKINPFHFLRHRRTKSAPVDARTTFEKKGSHAASENIALSSSDDTIPSFCAGNERLPSYHAYKPPSTQPSLLPALETCSSGGSVLTVARSSSDHLGLAKPKVDRATQDHGPVAFKSLERFSDLKAACIHIALLETRIQELESRIPVAFEPSALLVDNPARNSSDRKQEASPQASRERIVTYAEAGIQADASGIQTSDSAPSEVNDKDKYVCSLRLTLHARREVRHWRKMCKYWERRARSHEVDSSETAIITPSSSGLPDIEEETLSEDRKKALGELIERRKRSQHRRSFSVGRVGHHRHRPSISISERRRRISGLSPSRNGVTSASLLAIGTTMVSFPSSSSEFSTASDASMQTQYGNDGKNLGEGTTVVSLIRKPTPHPTSMAKAVSVSAARRIVLPVRSAPSENSNPAMAHIGTLSASQSSKSVRRKTSQSTLTGKVARSSSVAALPKSKSKTPPRTPLRDRSGVLNERFGKNTPRHVTFDAPTMQRLPTVKGSVSSIPRSKMTPSHLPSPLVRSSYGVSR
ncbi:hypothetical protein PUNSTDRAFT_130644 [Punctularia strigosozonata HHB-11173 SS5]|uniref:uncharacterized protein n=1 Tax=Punctularia strigosozonata (strain HHB-11173) TaxID=741275 RepID=UPI0004416A16|nr:uncharacterized protein PUNSTDRAFT_130644 [Punctularia strigosozonata HHB-11173 SS5]EIN12394.1 hypothetical protein PUNSTDRAFT_130644 [Punctularia strigosozonata HHB-11173 SS5]